MTETTTAFCADFVDETIILRKWLRSDTVDTAQLAAELRRWAEHFEPLALDDDEAEAVLEAARAAAIQAYYADGQYLPAYVAAINDRGVVLRWESTADRHAFLTREDES